MGYKVKEKEIIEALKTSESIRQVLKKVGLTPAGGNYTTVNNIIRKYNIDTSHMTGQGWNVGDKFGLRKINTIPIEDILVENSTYVNTNGLRKRLISEGLKQYICEVCGNTEWNEQPISLELDHINGIRTDNRLENLRIICPNCHAQTKHYRGKNKKKVKND